MPKHKIPKPALPVTVAENRGHTYTETFSQTFASRLGNQLLRELGAVFQTAAGMSETEKFDKQICEFCSFLADTPARRSITSLNDLDETHFTDYVKHLKLKYPTAHTMGKATHPWYARWVALRPRLKEVSAIWTLPGPCTRQRL